MTINDTILKFFCLKPKIDKKQFKHLLKPKYPNKILYIASDKLYTSHVFD